MFATFPTIPRNFLSRLGLPKAIKNYLLRSFPVELDKMERTDGPPRQADCL